MTSHVLTYTFSSRTVSQKSFKGCTVKSNTIHWCESNQAELAKRTQPRIWQRGISGHCVENGWKVWQSKSLLLAFCCQLWSLNLWRQLENDHNYAQCKPQLPSPRPSEGVAAARCTPLSPITGNISGNGERQPCPVYHCSPARLWEREALSASAALHLNIWTAGARRIKDEDINKRPQEAKGGPCGGLEGPQQGHAKKLFFPPVIQRQQRTKGGQENDLRGFIFGKVNTSPHPKWSN